MPGDIEDTTDDYVAFDALTGTGPTSSLTATLTIKGIYKDLDGILHPVTKTLTYLVSTTGADGVDGGTIVQLSVYRSEPETYDNNGNLVYPATPSGGVFDFSQNKITAEPAGWTSTPPQVTDGVIFISSTLQAKDPNSDTITITDWDTPSVFMMFGGTTANVFLYTKSSSVPVESDKPEETDILYDFGATKDQRLRRQDDSAINMNSPFVKTGSAIAWYPSVPAGDAGDDTYVIQATFAIPGSQGIDNTAEWSDPALVGAQGKSLYNAVLVTNVAKDASAPTRPANNLVAYNFDLEQYEQVGNPGVAVNKFPAQNTPGAFWYNPTSNEYPALQAGEVVYAVRETFSTFGSVGTDETSEWTYPTQYIPSGSDGLSSYFASVFYAADPGEIPTINSYDNVNAGSGGIFDFDQGEFEKLPTGTDGNTNQITWLDSQPDILASGTPAVIWASQSLISSPDPKGKDETITWGNPVRVTAPGTAGAAVDIVFQRSSTKPNKPADSVDSPPSGWFTNVQNVTGDPLKTPMWSSTGKKEDQLSKWVWEEPVIIEGQAIAELSLYRRAASRPVSPTHNSFYDLGKADYPTDGRPPNWFTDIPDGTNPVWMVKGVASGNANQIVPVTWSDPPMKVFEDGSEGPPGDPGEPGEPGQDSIVVNLTNESCTVPFERDPNGGADIPLGVENTGTDITAWAGLTQCRYASSGANTFSVSLVSSPGIAEGNPTTVNGNIRRYPNIDRMSEINTLNSGSLEFNITVRDKDGNPTTVKRLQTFTKVYSGKDADDPNLIIAPVVYGGIITVYRSSIGSDGPTQPELDTLDIFRSSNPPTNSNINPDTQGRYRFYLKTDSTYAIVHGPNKSNGFVWGGNDKGWLDEEMIRTGIIEANAIKAEQLEVSSNEAGASRMFFDGANNRIRIFDSNGNERVRIGKLT